MNLPTIFNIAIGLIFIYLVLSLLASQIQEVIATILEWRAKNLTSAIENLVSGETDTESKINSKTYDLVDNIFKNPLIRNLNQTSKSWITKIRPQNKESNRNTINPAYMPAETFSTTVLYELSIPKLGRFLTWLNIEKLIYNEIYIKIETLLESQEYKCIYNEIYSKIETLLESQEYKCIEINKSFKPYTNLQTHFKHVLDDYRQERYGLSSTIIRLRNQVENFKREIEESLPTQSITPYNPLDIPPQESNSEIEKNRARKTLKVLIYQIVEFVFTPDKNDHDLLIRLRPSLTTLLELLDKESDAYKSCEKEFSEVSPLHKSFVFVREEFDKTSKILPDNLRKSLYALALRSRIKASDIEQQLDQFKQEIEVWFDRSMDRASGVYKRNARGFAFLIGFVLAVALNADTFYIVSRLAKDDALRNSIVSASSQLVQNVQAPNPSPTATQLPITKSSSPAKPSPTPTVSPTSTPTSSPNTTVSPIPTLTSPQNTIESVKNNVDQSLSDISLPIGWTDNILDEQLQRPAPAKDGETPKQKQNREIQNEKRRVKIFGWYIPLEAIMIMGWVVTATAIMMGAPFWFDFLGLFINVRNTGSRPTSKTDKN